jgi:hypothetical protein
MTAIARRGMQEGGRPTCNAPFLSIAGLVRGQRCHLQREIGAEMDQSGRDRPKARSERNDRLAGADLKEVHRWAQDGRFSFTSQRACNALWRLVEEDL